MKSSLRTNSGKLLTQVNSHVGFVAKLTASLATNLTDLFIPWRWSSGIISELLNAPSEPARNALANTFVSSTLSGLKNVGLTAGLVAGVISSAFSWTDVADAHWLTLAFWYSGLVFAFTSISSAGLCTNALLRLKWHTDIGDRVRNVLGYPVHEGLGGFAGEWRPRAFQPWIWGSPGALLKVSLLAFLVGLGIDVWCKACRIGLRWGEDQLKVAVFVTIASACAAVMYSVAVICLFYRTVSYEESKKG